MYPDGRTTVQNGPLPLPITLTQARSRKRNSLLCHHNPGKEPEPCYSTTLTQARNRNPALPPRTNSRTTPSDRRRIHAHFSLASCGATRRTVGDKHKAYTLQRTALSHDLITSIPSDRRRKHAHLRRRRFHHDPTRTRAPNPNPKWNPQILPSPPQPPTRQ